MNIPKDGILSCIGKTPLVRLTRVLGNRFQLYAKLEGLNPGGSIKDRSALEIISQGIREGKINEQTVIVEATSGNMGIALALICRRLGLRLICVVDRKATPENLMLIEIYGAELEVVTAPDRATGDLLQARINRAREIACSIPGSYWINQYANPYNARAHHRTMDETLADLGGQVHYVFCSASSCGTLRGCSDYVALHRPGQTQVWAVDAEGSVIFGGCRGQRAIPGHGAGIRPGLYRDKMADRTVPVTDLDCIVGCRRLLASEGLLVGGSSGGIYMAVEHSYDDIPSGSNCVMLLPDRGERYLSTVFANSWVRENYQSRSERDELSLSGFTGALHIRPGLDALILPEKRGTISLSASRRLETAG
jgi:cysteine synthase A